MANVSAVRLTLLMINFVFAIVFSATAAVTSSTPTSSNCNGHGTWKSTVIFADPRVVNDTTSRAPGSCECDSSSGGGQFIGPECNDVQCPNNCGAGASSTSLPHGECFQVAAGLTPMCFCNQLDQRRGADCSLLTCEQDCNGHGKCESGVCRCHAGWTGLTCGEATCDCVHGVCGVGGACACDDGWTGPKCELHTCESNCHANLGHGYCINGTCACAPGFGGDICELVTCPNLCSGVGECNNATGMCACPAGTTGNDCSQSTCPYDCGAHGKCGGSACNCDDGWAGRDCSLSACAKNCSGRGVCHSRTCFCHKGWTGAACDTHVCPLNCSGHGECDLTTESCHCGQGWMGFGCELVACHGGEEHAEGMCSGNGYCEDDGHCTCKAGWGGERCNVRRCPNSCSAVGVCKNGTCECPPERGGADCGELICPRLCSGHGECIHPNSEAIGASEGDAPYCECRHPYVGDDCSKQSCQGNCSGHGFCRDGQCYCEAGFSGDNCELDLCQCSGHGACQEGTNVCECAPGWIGAVCALKECPYDCNGNGLCDHKTGKCDCFTGAAGRNCSTHCPSVDDEKYDQGQFCSGNGHCQDSGKCACDPGWGGADCGQETCGGCTGHGNCFEGQCVCNTGWSGSTCQNPDPGDMACECHTRCTNLCLDTCRGIVNESGVMAGHRCFNNCQQVCATNCLVRGQASVEDAFTSGWAQPDYFSTHVMPQPEVRPGALGPEDLGVDASLEGSNLLQAGASSSAARPFLQATQKLSTEGGAQDKGLATFDED